VRFLVNVRPAYERLQQLIDSAPVEQERLLRGA
jgi:hypothetical protein